MKYFNGYWAVECNHPHQGHSQIGRFLTEEKALEFAKENKSPDDREEINVEFVPVPWDIHNGDKLWWQMEIEQAELDC